MSLYNPIQQPCQSGIGDAEVARCYPLGSGKPNRGRQLGIQQFAGSGGGMVAVRARSLRISETVPTVEKRSREVPHVSGVRFSWRKYLYRDIRAIAEKAGIKGMGVHTLRHTFASHLVMAGVDLATVQKLMGHSSITTTMIYAHLAPDHLKAAVEKLKFG